MRGSKSSGVSLIELMVVIAVVAILAVVATPSYQALIDNYRVRKAGEDVVSLISNARSGAVKLHRQVNVNFTSGASWCAGANAAAAPAAGAAAPAATACNCSTPATCLVQSEQLVIPTGKHPGVTMASASNALVFNGITGVAQDNTGSPVGSTVVLDSPLAKFQATITVTPLGQANLAIAPK